MVTSAICGQATLVCPRAKSRCPHALTASASCLGSVFDSSRSLLCVPATERAEVNQGSVRRSHQAVKSYGHVETWHDAVGATILSQRKVEHCVQYRETDFNFLSRTLERYGVYYYFKHEATKHTLVLCDKATYPDAIEKEIRYAPSAGGQLNEDTIKLGNMRTRLSRANGSKPTMTSKNRQPV